MVCSTQAAAAGHEFTRQHVSYGIRVQRRVITEVVSLFEGSRRWRWRWITPLRIPRAFLFPIQPLRSRRRKPAPFRTVLILTFVDNAGLLREAKQPAEGKATQPQNPSHSFFKLITKPSISLSMGKLKMNVPKRLFFQIKLEHQKKSVGGAVLDTLHINFSRQSVAQLQSCRPPIRHHGQPI